MTKHIHIVGFKRSGTTLLHQLFHCFKDTWVTDAGGVHLWDVEVPSDITASTVVSKYTKDALHIDRCLAVPNSRLIYMIRDPRDTLASKFRGEEEYASNPEKLVRRIKVLSDAYFVKPPLSELLVLRYEDLVTNPIETQEFIGAWANLDIDIPFTEGYERFDPGSGEFALNGIRPIDSNSVRQWRLAEHKDYVERILVEHPEIQEFIEKFYADY